jgi:large subunit ribosomal protein L21
MLKYAVVKIKGKQYITSPEKPLKVDYLGEVTEFECSEVLLSSSEKGLEVGTPALKTPLKFKVIENGKGKKIRVFKYHSKSNTRKTSGIKPLYSLIQLQ